MQTYRTSRLFLSVSLLALLAACGGPRARWSGARGYDGHGDYGYDVNASLAESRSYRYHASGNYPPPGPASDPWGPYIQEAAGRFSIPARWIREVMRQESGGRIHMANGSLTTSWVGAMGLMQVMPGTYDVLRRHYGLGDDPYEPHDNIMAGAAYIREMYDRFGSPGFLAAYNAGPERVASYLAGQNELPSETVNYLSSIAPRLGTEVAMSGPLAAYGSGGTTEPVRSEDRAYAGGGMSGSSYYNGARYADAAPAPTPYTPPSQPVGANSWRRDPADDVVAAADTGNEVPATYNPPSRAPEQVAEAPAETEPAYSPPRPAYPSLMARANAAEAPRYRPAMALAPVAAPDPRGGVWAVQVGAFPDAATSRAVARSAQNHMARLYGTQPLVEPVLHQGNTLYRARLTGLTARSATAACADMSARVMACFTVPPGS